MKRLLYALGAARQGEGVAKCPSPAAASFFYAPARRHTFLIRAGLDTLLFIAIVLVNNLTFLEKLGIAHTNPV